MKQTYSTPPSALIKLQIDELEVERRRSVRHLNNLKKSLKLTTQGKKNKKKANFHLQRINEEISITQKRLLQIEKAIANKEDFYVGRLQEEEQMDYLRWHEENKMKKESKPRKEYDVFISHATLDKDEIVRPLAESLKKLEIKVWFDEFELKLGDSLREKIDIGLKSSEYGLIILSNAFFNRPWTQYELNGFVAREMNESKVILPIWHKVSKDEVINFSPNLADKVALKSSDLSIDEIAMQVKGIVS